MKNRKTLIFVFSGVFVLLICAYFFAVVPLTRVEAPEETTAETSLAPGEVSGYGGRVQMFDQITSEYVKTLYVKNEYGAYKFVRGDNGLVLEGHENLLVDPEKFAQMIVNAGYTLSTFNASVTEEDFYKYGLTPEESDTYFVLESTTGRRHVVYIGDKTLAGNGYYARYEGRNAIYVLDDSIEGDLLAPAASLIRPLLAYPSSINTYYLMQTFLLGRGEDIFLAAEYLNPDKRSDLAAMSVHRLTYPAEYPAGTNYDDVLTRFCDFSGSQTVAIDFDDETLEKYGLLTPAYTLYAVNAETDDAGNPVQLIENYIIFSEKQQDEAGNYFYYAASYTFGVIARVEQITVDFLEWDLEKWVSPNIFQINIQKVRSLSFDCAEVSAVFELSGEDNDSLRVTETQSGYVPEMKNFRQLWKVLLSVTQEGLAELYGQSIADLTADDSNLLLTMTVVTRAGVEQVYRFYPYTDRRVYYTVNGEGSFYVNRTMLNKVISDVQRVMRGETVDSESRY